ncbi:hypothetical protein [Desulfocurvus sp. DL9XJH121]
MARRENRIRRAMLLALYERFKEAPLMPVELRELADELDLPRAEARWNAAYLSLAGLLSLSSVQWGTGLGLALTAPGVDLAEEPRALRARFPLRSPARNDE